MKWPTIVAKCVSNLNSRDSQSNLKIFKSRGGMGLAELMVVMSISLIVMLGAGSVMVFVADSFSKIIDKDEAEGSITRAAYALRTIATQAVGLYVVAQAGAGEGIGVTGEAGAGASTNLYQGQIVHTVDTDTDFVVGTTVAHRGRMVEVAQFFRETSAINQNANSFFMPTAIFFKTPWNTCPPNPANSAGDGAVFAGSRDNCSGQLIIVWNTVGGNLTNVVTAPAGAGGHQLAAFPGGNIHTEIFDRFTALRVTTSGLSGNGVAGVNSYAKEATFRLTARYFLGLAPQGWNYDPDATTLMAKEVTMDVLVGFRNNYQGRSVLGGDEPERLHGSRYYFPFVSTLPISL